MEILERLPKSARNTIFEKLAQVTDVAALTEKERFDYDIALKRYRDTMAVMKGQKQEGFQQGSQQRSLEIARNFKHDGIPLDIIARNTGLPVEDIEKL